MSTRASTAALRLTVTVGLLLILLFVVADPGEIIALVSNITLIPFLGAVLLSTADRFLMAYKWWLLLRSRNLGVRLWTAFRCYLVSSLYGLILPVTVGADAIRILAIRQLGITEVAASIIIERGLGVLAMGSVALLSSLLLATSVSSVQVESLTLWLTIGIAIMVVAFTASLHFANRWALRKKSDNKPRLRKAAEAYARYRLHPGLLAVFYLLSVVESLLSAVIVYVVALGLGISLPLYIFVATVPLALASARLPISLGGFGVQEASFVFLAGLLGVPNATSLTIMLIADVAMLIALLPALLDSSMLTLRQRAKEDADALDSHGFKDE